MWSEELGDYPDPIWETVVLRSPATAFDEISVGNESTYRLGTPEGAIGWTACPVELLKSGEVAALIGVGGLLAYTIIFEGKPCEFLSELELPGPAGGWRLKQRVSGPSGFTLARHEEPN